jgi:hypothetical protein
VFVLSRSTNILAALAYRVGLIGDEHLALREGFDEG